MRSDDCQNFSGHPYIGCIARSSLRLLCCLVVVGDDKKNKNTHRTLFTIKYGSSYVLWNAVSVPLLQFARYCSIVQTLSLEYPGRDRDLEVT